MDKSKLLKLLKKSLMYKGNINLEKFLKHRSMGL